MYSKLSLTDILLQIDAVKNSDKSTKDKIRLISFLRKELNQVVQNDQA